MARNVLDDRIRVGDFVKVRVPKFVARVGYPKGLEDYKRELETNPHFQQAVSLMLEITTGDDQIWHDQGGRKHRSRYRIESEVAYLMARRDGFGGPERSIHWVEHPEHQDAECTVEEVRTVYTGRYYPPSGGGSTNFFGEDESWYEPGGLSDMKCHRLARVNLYAPTTERGFLHPTDRTLELPVYHLQKLRSAAVAQARRRGAA